ncbi:hypothetical protein Poly24_24780 [Rosistilla carotiformis]|uniref:Uncharacterized protein n=1 Tax=Rosistilla carotiformis TaxID=2528017 RepID=A0A518JTA3_9BACT|nr:hypothetical protein [Rosistilla carotiformis]QDV68765.1 hypothetical protein Poly24_24780 [Rosistilla carotiformis]
MNETSSCCAGMKGFYGVLAACLLCGIGYLAGTQTREPGFSLPPHLINATASDSGEEFSLATGRVSGDAEGLFVLDHATGLLQCYVMYPRTAKFGAVFSANVGEALAGRGEKGSKYIMVTGDANFPGGGRSAPAGTVLYVLDGTSGAFVAYGLPFDRTMMTANRSQQGVLTPLDMGQVRQMAIRE